MYKSKVRVQATTAVSSHHLFHPARGGYRQGPSVRGRVLEVERMLLRGLLHAIGNPPIRFVLWNGEEVAASDAKPVARIVIHDHASLAKYVINPELYFGDLYGTGRLEVEGDMVELIETVFRAVAKGDNRANIYKQLLRWLNRPRANNYTRSRDNIHHHYDIGNGFYRLWLDNQMVYTCAYFPAPDASLEQAQIAKMHHVCRKLQLKPGDSVVEAGCGWGALACFMAKHYGVRVRAYNISHQQIVYAREQATNQGLADRVEFIEDDYRNITGQYDAFVSIGMLEHVGADQYPVLGQVIDRCLKEDGRGLLHSIGRNRPEPLNAWIVKRIFPGAYPPTLREMMGVVEPAEFSVLDVENLRLHYAKTLEHWLWRYEKSVDQVRALFDEVFVRSWRVYLAGSLAAFNNGDLQLFQVSFARRQNNAIPWTRAHLYTEEPWT